MNKVWVIGLDGGTWRVIRSLTKSGKLPAIAKLVREGSHGDLESSIPATTFPAWKCYSTGKNPGKLGVYDFSSVDLKQRKLTFNNSLSFKSKELWDYLGEADITCGIIDMPGTYPPKEVNGFMVSHSFADISDFTYPKELEAELMEQFGYKVTPEHLAMMDKDLAIADCRDVVRQRFAVVKHLMRRSSPRFLHLTQFYTDHIQHYYWKYWESNGAKYSKVIEEFWTLIDTEFAALIKEFWDEETYIILMSDHGFAPLKGEFNLVPWLVERKLLYLTNRSSLIGILAKLGLSSDKLVSLVSKLGIYSLVRKIVPQELQFKLYKFLPHAGGGVNIHSAVSMIDWDRSQVLPLSGGIYINPNAVNDADYKNLRDQLIAALSKVRDPIERKQLFTSVYRKEDIYSGEYLNRAPDILLDITDSYEWTTDVGSPEWCYDIQWSGGHARYGIFCINGPGIKGGYEIEGARLIDLAPTILHLFGVPIPKDMDGRPLSEVFNESSELATRRPRYQQGDETTKLKTRIKALKQSGKI